LFVFGKTDIDPSTLEADYTGLLNDVTEAVSVEELSHFEQTPCYAR
jgi:hypothetical protein